MTVAPARPASAVLTWSRDLVQPALRAAVDRLPAPMRRIAGYHLGWWDQFGDPVDAAGGKAVRPALVLLAAEASGARPDDAVPAAVAVELAHNFTLLHDDVLDRDRTRRHRPTAWAVFGVSAAILAGDALLALAADVLAGSDHPAAARVLTRALLDLVDGEHADLTFERRPDVGVRECLEMVEHKTAPLLAAACALGATFAGAPPSTVAHLHEFGRLLGIAYQHVDDLLGIWGDPAKTGKPAHTDLRSRKKSLPVVAALASDTPPGRELSTLYRRTAPPSPDDVVRMADLVERAGGRSWSRDESRRLLDEALDRLADTAPAPRPAAELAALAHLVVNRER
ncbi:family 2 encapsulin nanocompartment cargo protein polyprenyl transferase [Saccharothrix variisporea]|uniref:Geranylgeranyl diphosphate synthase type I n=1 Tax=Saccharothrix variisporea TaxID=543527 RepID=A0A495X3Z5_9PSEU|nr:family 2 encapsulin nanocompartment cargo protein polyprenyl transferase [Saccharothrix variisporea]RKT68617.1 geranylgeranyl diphosphate synthase type I [Saccharothrix variisporea]